MLPPRYKIDPVRPNKTKRRWAAEESYKSRPNKCTICGDPSHNRRTCKSTTIDPNAAKRQKKPPKNKEAQGQSSNESQAQTTQPTAQVQPQVTESQENIYVPIRDDTSHWFLMVVHVEERKIYHLDSHLLLDKIDSRHQMMKKIAKILSLLVLSIYNLEVPFCLLPDFEDWDIVEPRGVPNCGHRDIGCGVDEYAKLFQQSSYRRGMK
ncbi:hypothetical protein QL285_027971 [Trifolium repens]|nr:hypothetical protein QL285_027971 [Trifolium repens]